MFDTRISPQCDCHDGLRLGSHLVSTRFGYSHHGIYVGEGKVVHYGGFSRPFHPAPVEEVSLQSFARGHEITVENDPSPRFHGVDVVARARSRIGENSYKLFTNNCEHFCAWCIQGVSRSAQVDDLLPGFAVMFASLLREVADPVMTPMPVVSGRH